MFRDILKHMMIIGGICAGVFIIVAGGFWLLNTTQTGGPSPVVTIHSPSSGIQIAVGEPLIVQSTSSDPGSSLAGVELWAAQGNSLALVDSFSPTQETHSLSLTQQWIPSTPGSYRIIIQANNQEGNQGQAAVELQVVNVQESDGPTAVLEGSPPPVSSGVESSGYFPGGMEEEAGHLEGSIPSPPDPDLNPPFRPTFLAEIYDSIFDDFVLADYNEILVEVEALTFTVRQEYEEVYCYVGLGGNPVQRIPEYGSFDVSNTNEWNLPDYMGGSQRVTVSIPDGQNLDVVLECAGFQTSGSPPDWIGFYEASHPPSEWGGQVHYGEGTYYPEDGFDVSYRIFKISDPLEAPINLIHSSWGGDTYLQWTWMGSLGDIDGFKIYRNHRLIATVEPDQTLLKIPNWWIVPPCNSMYKYLVVAYYENLESAPSNELFFPG